MQHKQLQKISGQLPRVASFLITYSMMQNIRVEKRSVRSATIYSYRYNYDLRKMILPPPSQSDFTLQSPRGDWFRVYG